MPGSTTAGNAASSKKKSIWNYRPDLPLEYSPLFEWPFDIRKVAKWVGVSYLTLSIRTFILLLAALSWFAFTPSMAVAATLEPGWVLALLARNLVMMLVIAGGLHLYFYTYRKQGDRLRFHKRDMVKNSAVFKFKDQVLDNMYFSLVYGVGFWTLLEVTFLWLYANNHVNTLLWNENPIWFVVLFLIIPIWHSFHFYCIHRFLHWPPLYKRVHALHHRNVNIGPWSGMSMHPVETFLYLTSVLVHLVVLSSPFHVVYHLQFLIFNAAIAHSGFDSLLINDRHALKVGRFHHQLHHRHFECNYGNAEMPWDRWFGSFHDGTDEATERMTLRLRRLVEAQNTHRSV